MEKLFTPNKWFVGFCALLIVVVAALKIVGDMRIAEHANLVAKDIFEWEYPALNLSSRVMGLKSHVVRRDGTEAIVEVTGHQTVAKVGAENKIENETSIQPDARAVLTFYKRSNQWELGKVELK